MNHNYPKTEKLKKKKYIDLLFSEGRTVTKYPLRLVYVPVNDLEMPLQMGVSVSKKYFKKAVDRNYFKRVLRECYRTNKELLLHDLKEPYVLMFFYQTKERLTFNEIETKTKQLFEKFADNIKKRPDY
ncbi:ribonuclease P protein component [Myroides sp. JBRI-B21084]|uniref:ribonuclease P protein component n=1 Tax=Myroides sp. JBRI-B21084 TaxID=3119977 RepID=UPI0026E313E8|nr:ribonuclease P protein component [Paenimyroides cloacae]WKW45952.1 ribonuclease P protein component [Paenimyroides cloacae]